jgi:hypothetical protein
LFAIAGSPDDPAVLVFLELAGVMTVGFIISEVPEPLSVFILLLLLGVISDLPSEWLFPAAPAPAVLSSPIPALRLFSGTWKSILSEGLIISGAGVSISEILEVMSELGDGVLVVDNLSLLWLFSILVFPVVDWPNIDGDNVDER